MGFLANRRILVTGVLSNRSIVYGIARACQREGAALAFTYVNDDLKDRVVRLAADFEDCLVWRCDVTRDDDIDTLEERMRADLARTGGVMSTPLLIGAWARLPE